MKMIKKKIDEEEQGVDIPALLRKLACDEIVSYHAYITASKNIRGQNWLDVKQEFEQHAKTEFEHYESILDRLYQLGQPVHAVFNTISECAGYYWDMDMSDPKEACEVAKKAEQEAVEGYRSLLVAIAETPVENRDFATQRLAKEHLENEQDHVQDIVHLLEEFK